MFQHLAVLFMRNTNHTGTILSVPPPQATLMLNHHQIIMFTHHSTVSMNQDIYHWLSYKDSTPGYIIILCST